MLGIRKVRDAQRDDPFRVRLPPTLVDPIVERLGDRQPEILVLGRRVDPAREPGDHGRKIERSPHPVDVHVLDTGIDVPATGPHLLEAVRLGRDGLGPTSRDGIGTGLGVAIPVELPDFVTFRGLDDPGREWLEPSRQSPFEHVGRLHQVVVDRDDGVVHLAWLGIGQQELRAR